jgi:hypothetical protein
VRFSAGFGSSDRPFKCGRVAGGSLVGGALEGASPAVGITLRFSGVGWSLEGASPDGGHTIIDDGAC